MNREKIKTPCEVRCGLGPKGQLRPFDLVRTPRFLNKFLWNGGRLSPYIVLWLLTRCKKVILYSHLQRKAPLSLFEEKKYRYRRKICTHAHKKVLHQDTKKDYIQQFAKKKWYCTVIQRKKLRPLLARANCRLQSQYKARSL